MEEEKLAVNYKKHVGRIYTGEDFNALCNENGWTLVKYLCSNDLSKPQVKHQNFHYRRGLNYIPEAEQRISEGGEECSQGGLYFTFLEEPVFKRWAKRHCFRIEIPRDSKVLVESEYKFKTNKLLLGEEMDENFYKNHWAENTEWILNTKHPSIKICLTFVSTHGCLLRFIENQTPKLCISAVRADVSALQYVKDQTYEICMEAIRKDGLALQFVREQTREICIAAIEQNCNAFLHVKNQTPEICSIAIMKNPFLIGLVKEPTCGLCLLAELSYKNCGGKFDCHEGFATFLAEVKKRIPARGEKTEER